MEDQIIETLETALAYLADRRDKRAESAAAKIRDCLRKLGRSGLSPIEKRISEKDAEIAALRGT